MTTIIFDYIIPINRKARARRSDPAVSHNAAKRVELGKAAERRQSIYTALEMRGPMTVMEISYAINLNEHEVGRRIGEIRGIAPNGEVRNGARVWGLV